MVQAQLYLDLLPYEFKFDFSWKLFLYIEIRRGYWTVLDVCFAACLEVCARDTIPTTRLSSCHGTTINGNRAAAGAATSLMRDSKAKMERIFWQLDQFPDGSVDPQTPMAQWPNGTGEIGKSVQDSCRFVRDFFFAQALETWKPSIIVQGQFSIP